MGVRVAVVGAGIAGLTAAWHLVRQQPGLDVTLMEATDRVGGKLRLEEIDGGVVDVGAESVLALRPEALDLLAELGLEDRITHPAAVSASIVVDGTRWPMPRGTLMGVPSDPESVRGILTDDEVDRLRSEPPAQPIPGDVSVGDFIDQRLGTAVTDKLVEPLLAGVYAGHARNLSLAMSIPPLWQAATEGTPVLAAAGRTRAPRPSEAAQQPGPTPVFATLSGGLGSLPLAMVPRLSERGVSIRTDTIVRRLQRRAGAWVLTSGPTIDVREDVFDAVVLATPAAPTARLLREVAPRAAERLARIESASMAIVTIVLEGAAPDLLDGSGFLVPPTEPLTIKAATFSSVKWPWLATAHPERTFLRASIGRHREESTLHRSDEELVAVALSDLAAVLGQSLPSPLATHVQRWGGGLPQYAVGHRELVDGLTEPAAGLALAGAAYAGVGVPACIASARRAAAAILTHLRPGRADLG
jgi:oxygen-dependent protoporphyrinogen oxidase